jgi:hypothetical protein
LFAAGIHLVFSSLIIPALAVRHPGKASPLAVPSAFAALPPS